MNTKVTGLATEFGARLNLINRFLALDAKVDYSGPVISASTSDEATFLEYEARLLMDIKAKPINLSLTAEYFGDDMTSSDDTFGYKSMRGTRYGLFIYSPSPVLGFDISLYFPIWNQIAGRSEYRINLTWRPSVDRELLSEGQEGIFIALEYYKKDISFEKMVSPVEIKTTNIFFKMGVSF